MNGPGWSRALWVAIACVALSCGESNNPPVKEDPPDAGGTPSEDPSCAGKELVHALPVDPPHTATCNDVCGNGLNPPTGGAHCGQTLSCQVFDQPQLVCEWVHNLEHGHAVLLYNCPEGCPEIVAALNQVWTDAGSGGRSRRILIVPDPQLPKKVGAVVWGWSWTGDAFDADAVKCILSHQDLDAPEAGLGCAQ